MDISAQHFPSGNAKEPSRTWLEIFYPEIGTCGNATDEIRISVYKTRVVPDIRLKYDGTRNGWVIGVDDANGDFVEKLFMGDEE